MSIGTEIKRSLARLEGPLTAAAAVGAAVAIQLFLERLPPNADMILPRRPLFFIYEFAMGLRGNPHYSSLISLFCSTLLIFSGVLFVRRVWKEYQLAVPGARLAWLALALVLILLPAAAAGALLRAILDILQHSWFKPESLDIREPAWACVAAALAAFLLWNAAVSLLSVCLTTRTRKAALRAFGHNALLIVAALGASNAAQNRFAESSGELSDVVGIPSEPLDQRGVLVLTEGPRGGDYEVQVLALGAPGSLDYAGYTVRMEAGPLRQALYLAHQKGDSLARLLLLENLTRAPIGEQAARLLDAMSDESSHRVGPRAAAMLSRAYSHFGLSEKSAYWREAAQSDKGGIPAGLLALSEAPLNGVIRGTLSGLGQVHAALYYHGDPAIPYSLGPSALVDSSSTDARGRFEFKGLPAGDYFLAFSFNPRRGSPRALPLGKCYMGSGGRAPCISFISNHKGDIRLDPERPKADLGVIELHFLK